MFLGNIVEWSPFAFPTILEFSVCLTWFLLNARMSSLLFYLTYILGEEELNSYLFQVYFPKVNITALVRIWTRLTDYTLGTYER